MVDFEEICRWDDFKVNSNAELLWRVCWISLLGKEERREEIRYNTSDGKMRENI
jgi:hypothetical protein